MARQHRNVNVRLDLDTVADLELVAFVEGLTVTQVVREAIEQDLHRRRESKAWQERKLEAAARHEQLMRRL